MVERELLAVPISNDAREWIRGDFHDFDYLFIRQFLTPVLCVMNFLFQRYVTLGINYNIYEK